MLSDSIQLLPISVGQIVTDVDKCVRQRFIIQLQLQPGYGQFSIVNITNSVWRSGIKELRTNYSIVKKLRG